MISIQVPNSDNIAHLAEKLAELPLFSSYHLSAKHLRERWLRALHENEHFFIATDNGSELGICWYSPTGTFGTGAYLRTLAVVPDSHSQGIGTLLLSHYERSTRASGGWFLLTSDFNTAAQRFYERHGYVKTGELPSFAHAGIVEFIYWKKASKL